MHCGHVHRQRQKRTSNTSYKLKVDLSRSKRVVSVGNTERAEQMTPHLFTRRPCITIRLPMKEIYRLLVHLVGCCPVFSWNIFLHRNFMYMPTEKFKSWSAKCLCGHFLNPKQSIAELGRHTLYMLEVFRTIPFRHLQQTKDPNNITADLFTIIVVWDAEGGLVRLKHCLERLFRRRDNVAWETYISERKNEEDDEIPPRY